LAIAFATNFFDLLGIGSFAVKSLSLDAIRWPVVVVIV